MQHETDGLNNGGNVNSFADRATPEFDTDTPEKIFETAISNFTTLLSDLQIDRFTTTTLRHVKHDIIIIQRDQDRLKAMMNLNRFHTFIDAFEQFDEVCKALDIKIPHLSGYIWGPSKSILQAGLPYLFQEIAC